MNSHITLIENREQLKSYIENNDSLYIQEKLPIDRDLRIVYVENYINEYINSDPDFTPNTPTFPRAP